MLKDVNIFSLVCVAFVARFSYIMWYDFNKTLDVFISSVNIPFFTLKIFLEYLVLFTFLKT